MPRSLLTAICKARRYRAGARALHTGNVLLRQSRDCRSLQESSPGNVTFKGAKCSQYAQQQRCYQKEKKKKQLPKGISGAEL